ncbi:hypothetical protein ACUNV4_21680 [Granulosicoccus sp. 3-233]|uniref:COG3904 family protein n=1 Tax=Granulosicoccus sp. 3-233 TaxID=3417969 RepID=UPI003D346A24
MQHHRSLCGYVSTHWQGQQSLAWSFWVNLVALRILVFTLQTMLAPLEGEDYHRWRIPVLVAVVACHVVLLCWQIVGVIRSADRHFSENGNMALVWGVQLSATLMFILSSVYVLGAVQMTNRVEVASSTLDAYSLLVPENYTISVSSSGKRLSIDGDIQAGMTRAVTRHLRENPRIEQVWLDSAGGNIFEARGLYRLFSIHRLATHVEGSCTSACTTAYVGGIERTAGLEAAFGFHQYRMDSPYASLVTTAISEQGLDEQLFLDAGVSREFVSRMFDSRPEEMWWPAAELLREHGVVHELR